jgi:hypothetical protein
MRKVLLGLAVFVMAIAVLGTQIVTASVWEPYVIRNSASGSSPTIIENVDGSVEFITFLGSQKAAWGNNDLSGKKVGDIFEISIDRLDDPTRFTAGSGPAVAPYFNIWITNGSGQFAVIANEPSNPEWTGGIKWDMTWDILKTKTVKVYENSDKSWLPNLGVGLTFEDLAAYTILEPSYAQLTTGWTGLGSGAPRELGTNQAYAFNWVFGDTLNNYVSGMDGYIVKNPVAVGAPVPEPATMILLGFGLLGVAGISRRKN